MPHLFDPIAFRDVTLANRIIVSPMCQYSSTDGFPNDWHIVHLGSRAVGGAGLVFTEAAAVTADGRISPDDLGIWNDIHIGAFTRVVRFIKGEGSAAGIQLAHAGRKASTHRPWGGQGAVPPEEGGWVPIAPTDDPFAPDYPRPRAMTVADIADVVDAFRQAARRALLAGFDVVEVHAAHGYLIHEFLSPLTNTRTDEYGGSFDNRIRLCLEVVDAVRTIWIDERPLFVRISSTDWVPGGWDIDQSIELARRLHGRGVDLIDCSSGGNVARADIPVGPGYQVPFAERVRQEVGVRTGAVGLITTPQQADAIIREGRADCVLLAREMLRNPYWPLAAARELGRDVAWPAQYVRAAPPGSPARA
jgi:2,4-dienoyl-CoA reductase-like NADH-dependent reductase (Old Yellow Enzyme family)